MARRVGRLDALVDALEERTLDGEGSTPSAVRRAAAVHAGAPPELGARGVGSRTVSVPDAVPEAARCYVDKVAHAAPRVTDEDVVAMKRAGLSEDAIFELTVAAALGAGLARYRIGMALLSGEDAP